MAVASIVVIVRDHRELALRDVEVDMERSRLRLGFRLGFRLGLRFRFWFAGWRRWRRRSRCRRRRRIVVAATREHETGAQGHGKKEKGRAVGCEKAGYEVLRTAIWRRKCRNSTEFDPESRVLACIPRESTWRPTLNRPGKTLRIARINTKEARKRRNEP